MLATSGECRTIGPCIAIRQQSVVLLSRREGADACTPRTSPLSLREGFVIVRLGERHMAYMRDDDAIREYHALRKEQDEVTRQIAELRRRARTIKVEVQARKAALPCIQGK